MEWWCNISTADCLVAIEFACVPFGRLLGIAHPERHIALRVRRHSVRCSIHLRLCDREGDAEPHAQTARDFAMNPDAMQPGEQWLERLGRIEHHDLGRGAQIQFLEYSGHERDA